MTIILLNRLTEIDLNDGGVTYPVIGESVETIKLSIIKMFFRI